jgi:hypothetical protein
MRLQYGIEKPKHHGNFSPFLIIYSFTVFFCCGVLVFFESTTENGDLRGQFVFDHESPRQKTVKV